MPLDHGAHAVNRRPVIRYIKDRPCLYRPALFLRNAVLGGAMRALHALFPTRRQVIFSSFHALAYGDGPMRVSERLHELDGGLPILWLLLPGCAGEARVPDYVTRIRPHTFRSLLELSRSRVAVDDFNLPYYRVRVKDQFIVQLWHGDRPFKKIMFDSSPDEPFPDGGITDLCVSGSRFGTQLYRRAFRYGGRILECGTPRCDILVSPPDGLRERVRSSVGIPSGARAVLYAPTFRDSPDGAIPPLDLARVKSALCARGGEWVTLSRAHVETGSLACGADLDVSHWPDMNELLLASDVLITDYSSCAADFALLDRKVLLYRPDAAQYVRCERGLYFTDSPFLCASCEDELIALLTDPAGPCENCAAIRSFFGLFETGHASQDTAREILTLLSGGRLS